MMLQPESKSRPQAITEDDYRRAFRLTIAESKEYIKQQEEIYGQHLMSILNELLALPAFMKHPAFEKENEWRLARFLFGGYEGVKFREGANDLPRFSHPAIAGVSRSWFGDEYSPSP